MPRGLHPRNLTRSPGHSVSFHRANAPTSPILLFAYDLLTFVTIADTAGGFTSLGAAPGIPGCGGGCRAGED